MGSPSTNSLSKGWGRESRSLKNGDAMASTDLWTRKLTLSDDRIMKFPSGMSKGSAPKLIWASGSSCPPTRDRANSACKRVQHHKQLRISTAPTFLKLSSMTDSRASQKSRMVRLGMDAHSQPVDRSLRSALSLMWHTMAVLSSA